MFEISVAAFYNDADLDKLTLQQIELLNLFEKVPDSKKTVILDIVRSFIDWKYNIPRRIRRGIVYILMHYKEFCSVTKSKW